jgi:sigma-B regulation protein RsbU (phosphoserine phosphatase)
VLGLFEGATYSEERLALQSGDTVILFSDGVTEALNVQNEEFGDERLIASLEVVRDADPQALLSHVLEQLRAFCNETIQTDDITMVLVRYCV